MLSLPLLPIYYVPLFFLIFSIFRLYSVSSRKHLPPSPPKLPILGNLHQIGTYPHRSLRKLAQKYGPLMLLHYGNVPVLVVSSALSAREIMRTHDLAFSSRPKSSIATRLLYDSKDMVFSPYGDYWRHVRSICVLHLLSNKRVQSFRKVREEETALMIDKIRSHSGSSSLVNMTEMVATLMNNIVCRVVLGRKYDGAGEGKKFTEHLGGLVELLGISNVGDCIPWLAWINSITGLDAKVDKVFKGMDEFLEGVVEERRNLICKQEEGDIGSGSRDSEKIQDFVDILLEIQRENAAAGCSPIQRDTVKALLLDMIGAGTETTTTALVWTMMELLRHPKVMKKLQNEVREIVRGTKPNVTEDDLEKMDYLKAVVKEGLRIHTPLPLLIPRESIQDVSLMGYDIAAGTQVLINAWAIARDPLSWDDPEEFRPERFLKNNSMDLKGNDFEFIPFGAGRRGCPGTLFGIKVIELALANVAHSFDLSLPSGGDDLDMTEATGLAIHKKTPLLLVVGPFSL